MPETTSLRLTDDQLEHWRRHGYVVVPEFFTGDEVDAALDALYSSAVPRPEAVAADPTGHANAFFGVTHTFPFAWDALNDLVAHDAVLDIVTHLTGSEDIVLSAAAVVAKYAGTMDFEQQLHCDYGNNTVVFPTEDIGRYRCVAAIAYLTEVTEELGPTYVVSQQHHQGDGLHPAFRPKPDRLYQHEAPVIGPRGTVLFYGLETFHRGSAMTAAAGHRISLHPVYRTADAPWLQRQGFADSATTPEFKRYVERVGQRGHRLVEVPPPGHPYWTERTLAGVAARYPDMDLTPYRMALRSTP